MQNHSDEELIPLLLNGSEEAFAVSYNRYAVVLYRYARKTIQDSEDCREIIQDIFESIWKRHADLSHVTVLNAYLYRTVKYKIIRYTKHQGVKRRYANHYRLFETMYDTIPEEERTLENVELMIETFLEELPERCQLAFRLRWKENLSNDDICIRMNIRHNTVRNYLVAALKHLRRSFQRIG
jgi:RNA polymerase sigma-70 factor (family 1)